MWNSVFGIAVVLAVFENVSAKGLPSFLKLCHRGDPNIRQCLSDNIEILRPRLMTGIPELFIPSLNPLVIPQATLNSGDNFKATFNNIQLYHANEFKLVDFSMDLDNYHASLKINFPHLRIKSEYNINGRILVLTLDGKGPADGNYTDVQSDLTLKGSTFKKNNKEFIKWEQDGINISIGKANLFFDKIFKDNEELNDQTNRVINQNIDTIITELKPVIQQVVSDFCFSIINRLFSKYSINDLFPAS